MTNRAPQVVLAVRIVAALGVIAFAVHTLVPDGTTVSELFDNRIYYVLQWLAVGLCGARVLLVRSARSGWLAITIGLAFWAGGDLYYAITSTDSYPSLADVGYLAFYPFVYAGFVLLFRQRVTRLPGGIWIDGLSAAFAVAAIGASVLLEIVLETTSGSFGTVATNLAYPLGDMVLLALIVGAFSVTGWQPGRAWLALSAGLVVNAIGDAVYLYTTANGNYQEGTLLDAAWPAAMVLVANAAWVRTRVERPVDIESRQLLVIPATCTMIAVGVLVADHFERLNAVALALATATLACVVARLGLTFRENRRLLELTRSEAVTDPLTGLGNRRLLLSTMEGVLRSASREDPWLFVIFDLDGFKGYNDTFGHLAGDALLVRLGKRLQDATPVAGGCFRLGGDEFCLLVPAEADGGAPALEAAIAALADEGEGFHVTTSFGAVFLPDEAHDPREALREADARLYAQKQQKVSQRDELHEVLLQALYEREPDLIGHTRGVARLAVEVGRRLELSDRDLEELERAAQLHDIGKIAVPDQILRKPSALTDDEWRFIRQHTVVGQRILAAAPALRRVGEIVRATHERWDGTGYPDAVAAQQIPLPARVIAVCDAYDAMTTRRPYRNALSPADAVAELRRCAGSQFDPAIVAVVAEAVHERAEAA
jgi:diguanylate cyclase (GGDEF)-like protein